MKLRVSAMVLMVALLVPASRALGDWDGPPPGAAYGGPVDESVFYDALSPYGDWISVPAYGWCWQPTDVPAGWRPYADDGHWAYTDAGYMWISDYDWGWAPFHYGRWAYDPYYGWIWVPGDVWAPAWVAWRWSDDWCGWAPLPPGVGWSAGFGLSFGWDWDFDRRVPDRGWCFVRPHDLFARRVDAVALPPVRNAGLLLRTRNVTSFPAVRGRPVDRGPDIGRLERLTGRSVQRFRVEQFAASPGRSGLRMMGNSIAVYRPEVRGAARRAPDERAMGNEPRFERQGPSGRREQSWGPGEQHQMRVIRRQEVAPAERGWSPQRREPATSYFEQRQREAQAAQDERRAQAMGYFEQRRREAQAAREAPRPEFRPAPYTAQRPGPPPRAYAPARGGGWQGAGGGRGPGQGQGRGQGHGRR